MTLKTLQLQCSVEGQTCDTVETIQTLSGIYKNFGFELRTATRVTTETITRSGQ